MSLAAEVLVFAALALVAAAGTVAPVLRRRAVPPLPPEPAVTAPADGDGVVGNAGAGRRDGSRGTAFRSGLPTWAVWTLVVGVVAAGVVPNLAASIAKRPGDAPETGVIPDIAAAASLSDLEAAVAADPTDVQARVALADRYLGMRRLKEATDQYLAVLQIDAGNADARAALGFVLYLSGRPLDGLKAVRTAIRLDPSNARARLFQAVILYRGLGRPKRALTALHDSLELSASGADARSARVLMKQIRTGGWS